MAGRSLADTPADAHPGAHRGAWLRGSRGARPRGSAERPAQGWKPAAGPAQRWKPAASFIALRRAPTCRRSWRCSARSALRAAQRSIAAACQARHIHSSRCRHLSNRKQCNKMGFGARPNPPTNERSVDGGGNRRFKWAGLSPGASRSSVGHAQRGQLHPGRTFDEHTVPARRVVFVKATEGHGLSY